MSDVTWKSVTGRAACDATEWLDENYPMPPINLAEANGGAIEEYRDNLESLAYEIEAASDSEWSDYAHESADSWDWVIYCHHAAKMVEVAPSDALSHAEDMVAGWADITEIFRDNGFSGLYSLAACWLAYEAISDACRDACENRLETIDKEMERVSAILDNMEKPNENLH